MLLGVASQTFSRLSGALRLSEEQRARLVRFYTRQLTISLDPPMPKSEDPFARVGLRVRFKQRAVTLARTRYVPVFM